MTRSAVHLDCSSALGDDGRLRERLRRAGMSLFYCTDSGEIERHPATGISGTGTAPASTSGRADGSACGDSDDWLARLVHSSSLFARFVKQAASGWAGEEEPRPVEPIPGMWLAPMPLAGRPRVRQGTRDAAVRPRGRSGYAVLILFTDGIFGSTAASSAGTRAVPCEDLAALCQSARMDYAVATSLIAQLPPAACCDVGRLVSLAKYVCEDHVQSLSHERAMESTGQQLAESYEEISLLYTIIQSMTVVEQPERFLTIACEELLDTLPYGWIGAQLCADRSRLKQLAGRFFLAGAWPEACPGAEVASPSPHSDGPRGLRGPRVSLPNPLILKLLHMVQPDVPMVLEPFKNDAHAEYKSLGNTVLVHPVSSDGVVIGLLAAGEKHGSDTTASNVDMKLLGAIASHMAIFLENAALYDDLNAMFLGTLEALTASIDAKDRYTCGHSQRVAHLTQQLARVIGLDENVVKRMHIAGLVHDVGKIGVPEGLLLKPGKLTDEEFAWIKRHPEIGYRILKDIPQLQDVLPGVLHHHERWDGKGYPKGLAGEEIPQVARLIGLADAFDAMSSTRTYRSAMDRRQVLKEIERCAGTQFDPALVPIFVELDFEEYDRMMVEHRAGGASPGISSAA